MRPVRLQWKLPDLAPPGAPRTQPKKQRQSEFRSPARYFSEGNLNTLVSLGRAQMRRWHDTLRRIEACYGVPARIVVAIWGRERLWTGKAAAQCAGSAGDAGVHGASQGHFRGRNALRTRQFWKKTTSPAPRSRAPGPEHSATRNSCPPNSCATRSISTATVSATSGIQRPTPWPPIANYLHAHDWQTGRDWGFEATIPQKISCTLEGPEQGRPIST